MYSLFDELVDTVEIDGKTYDLHLWFDVVLKFFSLMQEEHLNDYQKIMLAFDMFIDSDGDDDISIEAKIKAVHVIVDQFITQGGGDDDDSGNSGGSTKKAYDLQQDAKYIYASFMQEYGIDLIEQQGQLRWEKFLALMEGMRDTTKFQEIIGIRMAKIPTGKGSEDEARRLRKLKRIYALEQSQSDQEEEMNAMFANYLNGGKKK